MLGRTNIGGGDGIIPNAEVANKIVVGSKINAGDFVQYFTESNVVEKNAMGNYYNPIKHVKCGDYYFVIIDSTVSSAAGEYLYAVSVSEDEVEFLSVYDKQVGSVCTKNGKLYITHETDTTGVRGISEVEFNGTSFVTNKTGTFSVANAYIAYDAIHVTNDDYIIVGVSVTSTAFPFALFKIAETGISLVYSSTYTINPTRNIYSYMGYGNTLYVFMANSTGSYSNLYTITKNGETLTMAYNSYSSFTYLHRSNVLGMYEKRILVGVFNTTTLAVYDVDTETGAISKAAISVARKSANDPSYVSKFFEGTNYFAIYGIDQDSSQRYQRKRVYQYDAETKTLNLVNTYDYLLDRSTTNYYGGYTKPYILGDLILTILYEGDKYRLDIIDQDEIHDKIIKENVIKYDGLRLPMGIAKDTGNEGDTIGVYVAEA